MAGIVPRVGKSLVLLAEKLQNKCEWPWRVGRTLAIGRIPEGEIAAARRFLENLAASAALRATLSALPDDEPVTSGDVESLARAQRDIEAGKVASHFYRARWVTAMALYLWATMDECCKLDCRWQGLWPGISADNDPGFPV